MLTLLEKKQRMKRRNKAWWTDNVTMIEPNVIYVWTTAELQFAQFDLCSDF